MTTVLGGQEIYPILIWWNPPSKLLSSILRSRIINPLSILYRMIMQI